MDTQGIQINISSGIRRSPAERQHLPSSRGWGRAPSEYILTSCMQTSAKGEKFAFHLLRLQRGDQPVCAGKNL